MPQCSTPAPDPLHRPVEPQAAVMLLLTTFPDRERAETAACGWVEAGLAACVHIAANGRSVYRWQGVVETADEVAVTAKTTTDRVEALREALRASHPYELPEVLLVSSDGGSDTYLDWLRGACALSPDVARG
jgi:periplasmic divalent cation tolerance protein